MVFGLGHPELFVLTSATIAGMAAAWVCIELRKGRALDKKIAESNARASEKRREEIATLRNLSLSAHSGCRPERRKKKSDSPSVGLDCSRSPGSSHPAHSDAGHSTSYSGSCSSSSSDSGSCGSSD